MTCTNCSKPAAENRTLCQRCLETNREKVKRCRGRRKQLGLCAVCGKNPLANATRCKECIDKEKPSQAERARNNRAKRRANGLCLWCGLNKPELDQTKCRTCLDKQNVAAKKKYVAFKKNCVELLGGKCVDCGLVSEFLSVYDFHHRDPENKETNIAWLFSCAWERVVIELQKCDLICANCHRIRHEKEALNVNYA